ncbi:MAG: (2Fe-2S) ferredoxin domain-containing protein, partial [Actinomycetota bacterium]
MGQRGNAPSVLVCRGCCCGTERKHPDVDHDAHRERLREAAERAGGRIRTVDCVGPCERSNVVIVRRGTERHWFGEVNHDDEVERLGEWIAAGASGPLGELARHHFPKPVPPAERRLRPEWGPELAARCVEQLAD